MRTQILAFILGLQTCLFAQNKILNDISVIIHEETINKILHTIDSVSGTNEYETLLIRGKYHWKAKNFRISIRPDSSQFICDAKAEVGPFTYRTQVKGDVRIYYDQVNNKVKIKVTRAIFELYTKVLGAKIHLKNIDLADNFKEPFSFEGPNSLATDFDYILPDGTVKKIYLQTTECELDVKWKEIITRFELESCDVPFNTFKEEKK